MLKWMLSLLITIAFCATAQADYKVTEYFYRNGVLWRRVKIVHTPIHNSFGFSQSCST